MGIISTCDICHQIIKDNEKKYKLWIQKAYNPYNPYGTKKSETALVKLYNEAVDSTEYKELCSKCKKVLEYFFNIRKEKMNKVLKEIEKSYKPEELCQCINFEDKGLVMYGREDGICYICGKKKKLSKPLSIDELKKLIIEEDEHEI